MQIKFDKFDRAQHPIIFICNPDKRILSIVPESSVTDRKMTIAFNAVSSFDFSVYKYLDQNNDAPIENQSYAFFAKKRLIYVVDIGYFRITNVVEHDDGYCPYLDIQCTSAEIEWNDKMLYIQAGTYKFYDASSPSDTLFGKIMAKFPGWTLGTVDNTVAGKSRTFDYTEETVYSFVSTKIEQSYECIIDFNFNAFTVNVYDMNSLLTASNILFSFDNVLQNAQITPESDDVSTALYLTGSDNLQVAGVNPIGGNVLYNFTPFMTTRWMSQSLINNINAWNAKIVKQQTAFATALTNVTTAQDALNTLNSDLITLQGKLETAEQQKSLRMATNQSYSDVQATIDTLKSQISNKQDEIASKSTELAGYKATRQSIQDNLSFENNFTAAQLSELNGYIFQSSYTEDNLAVTDSMTWAEQTAIAQQLYDKGKMLLSKLAERRMEISADCESFIAVKDFATFRDEFKTGNLIHVKPSDGVIYNMLLLSYTMDDDFNLTVTFGNRYRTSDSYKRYEDLYNSVSRTANTVDLNKKDWSYAVKSGKLDDAYNFSKSTLDASKNAIISSEDEGITIDGKGITGKNKNTVTGEDDPEQFRLTHNALVFTKDGFQTASALLGKITFPNGDTAYGLVGDYIIGNIILGNNLVIQNESGSLKLDKNGLQSTQLDSIEDSIDSINGELKNVKALNITTDKDSMVVKNVSGTIDYTDCNVAVSVHYGSLDVTDECAFTFNPTGLTGSWNADTRIYSVTSLTQNTGFVDITVVYQQSRISKRFTVVQVSNGQDGQKGQDGQNGKDGRDGIDGTNGTDGVNGTDGIGVSSVTVEYYQSNSYSELTGGTWSGDIPAWVDNKYIWTRTIVSYTNKTSTTTDPVCLSGAKGSQGASGSDGKTSYLHIAYANSEDGSDGFSTTDSLNKQYMGQYTDFIEAGSTIPSDYTWVKIKGETGAAGQNGTTSYLHIKYSDVSNPTSSSQMSDTSGSYLGQCVTNSEHAPTNPDEYTWVKIKGEQGSQGVPGEPGTDGTTYYTWIKYADTPTSGMSDSPSNKAYIGLAYNKTSSTESTNYNDYSWSLIKGEQGIQGEPGQDGQQLYTWVKYATDANGTNMSDSPTDKTYIGLAYNKTTPTSSSTASDYTWALIKGADGVDGTNGADGNDGISVVSMTAKYAVSDSGTLAPTEGWSDIMPDDRTDSQYLWGYYVVTYSNNTSINTEPYVVAGAGEAFETLQNQIDSVRTDLNTQITQTQEQIELEASHTQSITDDIKSQIGQLQVSSDSVAARVTSIETNGVDKVVTETGATLDADGLHVTKSGEEMESRIDYSGLYVERDDEAVLKATNSGVEAENVTVRTYLTVGKNSRFEDYGTNRTGCFYIGGDS